MTSGRLEVLVNDVWGTVCSKHFGKNEAIVACRQLGFKTKSPHYSPISSAELVGREWEAEGGEICFT